MPAPYAEEYACLPGQEVAEIYKFAMLLILNIDHSPPILPPAYTFAIKHDRALGTNHSKGDHRLKCIRHLKSDVFPTGQTIVPLTLI